MNLQESYWAGPDGDSYTKRNRVDWRARIPFWHDIMKFTGARSVYEVGCGAGWNLSAIREAADYHVGIFGCDVNLDAVRAAWSCGFDVVCQTPQIWNPSELVFTAGVLIHVASVNLPAMMQTIIDKSSHYVLAIEYAADAEEMIEYRGVRDRLWKRPYGKLYEDLGCKILHEGEATGFDRCAYWLCERP